ncbi:MAG TPA: hypothetical protein VKQ11_00625 [Candidatus Sulfotelmatobacter sp.]|nr:hypothetical protein [Candidatus Sulfotelmatobacter sp.]
MKETLTVLLVLYLGSGICASLLGAALLWRMRVRDPLAKYMGIVMSIATLDQCNRFALVIAVPRYLRQFPGWLHDATLAIWAIWVTVLWAKTLYLTGVFRNGHSHRSPET